jgi:hypothetical protein
MMAALELKKRVNEALGITIKLNITSEALISRKRAYCSWHAV